MLHRRTGPALLLIILLLTTFAVPAGAQQPDQDSSDDRLFLPVLVQPGQPDTQPPTPTDGPARAPLSITGSLYAERTDVHLVDVASRQNKLYASYRTTDGNQILDIWDVQDVGQPQLIQSLDYGTIDSEDDAFTRQPRLALFEDTLVVRSAGTLYTYRHGQDGLLVPQGDAAGFRPTTPISDVGMGHMDRGGNFFTNRQLICDPAKDAGCTVQDAVQDTILDFTDPADPFLMGGETFGYAVASDSFNATFAGKPATLNWASDQITLTHYTPRLEHHLDAFWQPRLNGIVQADALARPVDALIEAALDELDLTHLHRLALEQVTAHLNVDQELTLAGFLHDQHTSDEALVDVMATYGIHPDDPLRLALEKVIYAALSACPAEDPTCAGDLQQAVAVDLYTPLLTEWMALLLNEELDSDNLASSIAGVLDTELTDGQVAAYLVDYLVRPMLDLPEELTWTLGELEAELASSAVGEGVSDTLWTAKYVGGGGLVDVFIDVIQGLGVDVPSCDFPGSTQELLDIALHGRGAGLDAQGLAFFELLKFYQYLNGNENYTDYTAEVTASVRTMHGEIGAALTQVLHPMLGLSLDGEATLGARTERYTRHIAVRELLARALADVLVERLIAVGVDGEGSLDAALARFDLYVSVQNMPPGGRLATVEDLTAVLTSLGVASDPVIWFFTLAESETDYLSASLRAALTAQIESTWGTLNWDASLEAVLHSMIRDQVDLPGTLGTGLEGLTGQLLSADNVYLNGGPAFTTLRRLVDGDCVAAWEAALTTAIAIAEGSVVFEWAVPDLAAILGALSSSYEAMGQYIVSSLIRQWTLSVFVDSGGSYRSWIHTLDRSTYTLALDEHTSLTAEDGYQIKKVFVWKDQLLILLWDESEPLERPVSLLVLDLKNPQATQATTTTDLGQWFPLNYIQQAGDFLVVTGDRWTEDTPQQTALVVDLTTDLATDSVTGNRSLPLLVPEFLTTANDGLHLVFSGPAGIFFVPRPVVGH